MDLVPLKRSNLTRAQFEQLSDVPPEDEWLSNITNLKTRRAYREDVREFIAFTGLHDHIGLRSVVRSHIIAWRKDMERRGLASASVRRKLSALSWLFDYPLRTQCRHLVQDKPKQSASNSVERDGVASSGL